MTDRPPRGPWSDADRARALDAYASGEALPEEIPARTIARWARAAGLPPRPGGHPPRQRQQVEEWCEDCGVELVRVSPRQIEHEIAALTGIRRHRVRAWMAGWEARQEPSPQAGQG